MHRYLLVVDMQKDFIDGALGSPAAQKIVENVEKRVREALAEGRTLLFTQDTHGADYMERSEGRHLPVAHCVYGTEGWLLHEKIAPYAGETVQKPSFGAPLLLPLFERVAGDGGANLDIAICGLCTDICVVTNALMLRAHFPEAGLSVFADSCAGSSEARHEAALEVLRACHVEVC